MPVLIRERGMTLVECAIALLMSSVLLAAVYAALVSGWRAARAQAAIVGMRQNVRAAAFALREEVRAASGSAGDFLRWTDSSFVLHATRGYDFTCAPSTATGIVLDDSLFAGTRAIDPSRDSAWIFREGDPLTIADDRWLKSGIAFVRRGSCGGGVSGTLLVLSGPTAAELAGVLPGAPVRTWELVEYRRYIDASGLGWLGTRSPATGGGWAATSPIAGPLRPADGIVLRFLTATNLAATVSDSVAMIEIAIHGLDPRTFSAPGRPGGPTADSLIVRVVPGDP